MHLKVVISIFMFLIFLSSSALAISTCSGGVLTSDKTITVNGQEINLTEQEVCPYGCATNGYECKSAQNVPKEFYAFGGISLMLLVMFFGYLGTKFDDWPLQTLFFGLSVIFSIAFLGFIGSFSMLDQTQITGIFNSLYGASVFMFLLVLLYFLIQVFTKSWDWLKNTRFK